MKEVDKNSNWDVEVIDNVYPAMIIKLDRIDVKKFFGNDKFIDCFDDAKYSFKSSIRDQIEEIEGKEKPEVVTISFGEDGLTMVIVSSMEKAKDNIDEGGESKYYKDITWKKLQQLETFKYVIPDCIK